MAHILRKTETYISYTADGREVAQAYIAFLRREGRKFTAKEMPNGMLITERGMEEWEAKITVCDICGQDVKEYYGSANEIITPIKWYHLGAERERWTMCRSCSEACAQYARAYSTLNAEGIANEIKRLAERLAEVEENARTKANQGLDGGTR